MILHKLDDLLDMLSISQLDCPVTWRLHGREAGGDLVVIQTLLLLLCTRNQVVVMLLSWHLN